MRYFWAALGGAAVGAAAVALFAPKTGPATRALLRDKATQCAHDVQDFAEGKSKHLKNKAEGLSHKAETLMQKGQELMGKGQEILGHGKEVVSQVQEVVSQGTEVVDKVKTAVAVAAEESTPAAV